MAGTMPHELIIILSRLSYCLSDQFYARGVVLWRIREHVSRVYGTNSTVDERKLKRFKICSTINEINEYNNLTSCAAMTCHARREFFVPKLQHFLSFKYIQI